MNIKKTIFINVVFVIIFLNSVTFAAVSSFVDNKVVHPNDGGIGQNSPTGVSFNPNGTRMYVTGTSCLLYTSPSPRDATLSRMPSSA